MVMRNELANTTPFREATDYLDQHIKRALRDRRTWTRGQKLVLRRVRDELRSRGYDVVLINPRENVAFILDWKRRLGAEPLDGLEDRLNDGWEPDFPDSVVTMNDPYQWVENTDHSPGDHRIQTIRVEVIGPEKRTFRSKIG